MSSFNKKLLLGLCSAATIAMTSQTASAANWLMLQGTEKPGQAPRAKVWGFIQAQYQKDDSDACITGCGGSATGYVPAKLIGPNLDSQEAFNVNRARIGVRGTGFPLDDKVNYFILAEFGNNGITSGSDGKHLTDASITLNHIPGARIRAGLFKTPGFEEGLQAIHVFDYINFTSVGNQLMLERFPVAGDTNQGATPTPNADMNQYSRAVGAFRDVGVQVFDTFGDDKHEFSYAVMYGNGNGLNYSDNDDNKDIYAYLSTEWIYGGKGPRREGLKLFVWAQDGTRTNFEDKTQEQDRTRSGLGLKYMKKPFRVTAEYLQGEGMIFMGQHRPSNTPQAGIYNNEKADGYYLDLGWYIPNSNWEIDLRYDSYTRGENHPNTPLVNDGESTFDTITLGTQYHFNKKTRINIEYADRDYKSDAPVVNNNLKGVKGRYAVQLTHIF